MCQSFCACINHVLWTWMVTVSFQNKMWSCVKLLIRLGQKRVKQKGPERYSVSPWNDIDGSYLLVSWLCTFGLFVDVSFPKYFFKTVLQINVFRNIWPAFQYHWTREFYSRKSFQNVYTLSKLNTYRQIISFVKMIKLNLKKYEHFMLFELRVGIPSLQIEQVT